MQDELGAYRPDAIATVAGAADGPLAGLTFAAKDLYDVAGMATGAGNPSFLEGHAPATTTASSVQKLLDAGATLVGKTITDELAFSLFGENHHYGTPINPAAPQRIPGGSSSGSASVVAGGMVDFALGSDTGGSVRVPASHCGIFGLRPTHGRIPIDGVVPLAQGFDTVGWFARTPAVMMHVGRVLLPQFAEQPVPSRLLIVDDAFARVESEATETLRATVDNLAFRFDEVAHVTIAPDGLDEWRSAFITLLGAEAWRNHGDWILQSKPIFGPGVAERFADAREVTPDDVAAATMVRRAARNAVLALLDERTVLCLPSAAGAAPFKGSDRPTLAAYRDRTLEMCCIAGLAGAPQIGMPRTMVNGCPLGISLVARPGGDEMLLAAAIALT